VTAVSGRLSSCDVVRGGSEVGDAGGSTGGRAKVHEELPLGVSRGYDEGRSEGDTHTLAARSSPKASSVTYVDAQRVNCRRPSVAIVAGITDVLHVRTDLQVSSKLRAIVCLDEPFRTISEPAVPEQEPHAAGIQVFAVDLRNSRFGSGN